MWPPHSLIRTNWGLGGWPAAASGTGVRASWREESPGGARGEKKEETQTNKQVDTLRKAPYA